MSLGSIKNVINNVYKHDLAFDNPQWVICHKTQLNQILYI